MKALAAAALGLHWGSVMLMLYEVLLWVCYGYIMVMLWLLPQLLHQVCGSYNSLSLLPAF